MAINKGKKNQEFHYKQISLVQHFRNFLFAECVILSCIFGGFYRGFPIDFSILFFCVFIYFNYAGWNFLYLYRSMDTFVTYENGIEVVTYSKGVQTAETFYSWDSVTLVTIVTPFCRVPKTFRRMKPKEGMPGIEIEFCDEKRVLAYQIIEGYAELYQQLKNAGVPGIKNRLPIFDRLDQYGQHKDGQKSSFFNNNGEPEKYIDIE